MSEALPVAATAAEPVSSDWSGGDQFRSGTVFARQPKAAALESGGFVLAYWAPDHASPESTGYPLRLQIHGADGSAAGPEIQIPSSKDGQLHPFALAVAGLPGGGFVVVYGQTVQRAGEQSGEDLFVQMFDSQGSALGGAVQVNSATPGDQIAPEIAVLDNGGFVVIWDSLGQTLEVKGQIFGADGQKAGGEFLAPGRLGSDVAALPGGGFIVAYETYNPQTFDGWAIRARLFDASANQVGDVEVFAAPHPALVKDPAVTLLAGGGWVISWTSERAIGAEYSVRSIQGQLFAADGAKLGDAFEVSPESTGLARSSRIVALADGGFVVIWEELYREGSPNSSNFGVLARFYDSSAVPEGDAIVVNQTIDDNQYEADAVALRDGGFVVAWSDFGGATPGSSATVQARVFAPGSFDARDDALATDEINVIQGSVFADNGNGPDSGPAGATLRVVAVNGSDSDVGQQIMLPSGALLTLNSNGSYTYDPNGAYAALAATFTGASNIYGHDSFTYHIAGSDEATVSVTIHGLWSDPHIVLGTEGADDLDGTSLADFFLGGGGDDLLWGNLGDDRLEGDSGADTMHGGGGDDLFVVDNAGDSVNEDAGGGTDEVRTVLAAYSLAALPNVENLTGTSNSGQDLRGNGGNNVITGGGGADILRLYDGGDDRVLAGSGNDNIFFIGSLTAADVVTGGEGTDTLVLQGAYGALTLTGNVTEIENVSILAGSNTNFGETGANRYDYVLTTNDANFAAGVQARINGAALLEGEDFTFDGSAETDARFVVYGGRGKDALTGGLGHDIFFFAEERFATGDTVNGGAGYDGMFLRGNYIIDFNAPGYTGLFTNIENLTLTSATDERYARGGGSEFDYNLTLSNAIVKPGETLTVSGALLMATETMILDASQESDGLLRLFGGRADDTLKGGALADLIHGNVGGDSLTGGGGADVFRYDSTAESDGLKMDKILDFTPGTDKIDLVRIDADSLTAGDQAFTWIGTSAFSGAAGELRVENLTGLGWVLMGDTDGDSRPEFLVQLGLQGPNPLGAGDFIL